MPVGVELQVSLRYGPGFEVEDGVFAGGGVVEDPVNVSYDPGVMVEGGFDGVFDAWLAVDGGDLVFGVHLPPGGPPVHVDGPVVHPPIVVFFVGSSAFADGFAGAPGGANVFAVTDLADDFFGEQVAEGGDVRVGVVVKVFVPGFGDGVDDASGHGGVPGVCCGVVAVHESPFFAAFYPLCQ